MQPGVRAWNWVVHREQAQLLQQALCRAARCSCLGLCNSQGTGAELSTSRVELRPLAQKQGMLGALGAQQSSEWDLVPCWVLPQQHP